MAAARQHPSPARDVVSVGDEGDADNDDNGDGDNRDTDDGDDNRDDM